MDVNFSRVLVLTELASENLTTVSILNCPSCHSGMERVFINTAKTG